MSTAPAEPALGDSLGNLQDAAISVESFLEQLCSGLCTDPLPDRRTRDKGIAHAPVRLTHLTEQEEKQAVKNALRYFPENVHMVLAEEFYEELRLYGHIYMYRFMPDTWRLQAYSVDQFPYRTPHAACIMLMILNNLDHRVAQYPQEMVTYGGNGQVFSNWAQFRLTMHLLSTMSSDQTLVMYSGHPHGLFPSYRSAPRMIITNGMVVPRHSTSSDLDRLFALGVSQYGQMTAGSYCYIGPQGIVHGTTLTVLNAGRLYLNRSDLTGVVFLTSGLGGMSGAQAKAAVIAGCIGIVAEVSRQALDKRYQQGWVQEIIVSLDDLINRIKRAKNEKRPVSVGFHGNIVSVWERLVEHHRSTGELLVELASDQTSCHAAYSGGYCPVQLNYEDSRQMMIDDRERFTIMVRDSLLRQVDAIVYLSDNGMRFWDYGNAFLRDAHRAGAQVEQVGDSSGLKFRFPSYVQDIMGNIFSLGFGPFRWVCSSGDPSDLAVTDAIAYGVIENIIQQPDLPVHVRQQYEDNARWIAAAADHKLVVGSQARILYSDCEGRVSLALAFNAAVADGRLKAAIIVSRDHHDVSGTDSPYRETSDVYDGSAFCADMAVHNFVGDAARGATWVALHNGGGVGWGEAINGGFGLVLDGSVAASHRAESVLRWDVNNGVVRRGWAGNRNAQDTVERSSRCDSGLRPTISSQVSMSVIDDAFNRLKLKS